MLITNKNKLLKYLFLYRSIFFKFISFKTSLKDDESLLIIKALNIKRRKKRIYFVINKLCDCIDEYYQGKNICGFKHSKCLCHREKNLNYINGCCRKCRYQTNKGCPTKNFACKMFTCSFVKDRYTTIKYEDLSLLKVLTPIQRYVLKIDYFASIDEVTKDINYGPLYSIFSITKRTIKTVFMNKDNS